MDFYLAIGVMLLGMFIIVNNWLIAYSIHVKKKYVSWVPILGGTCLAVGIGGLPLESLHPYLWLAFVIDYGCAPGLILTVWYAATRGKNED